MPGLADLHVHLFSADDLLPYAAWGVTTVANMGGSPQHLKWRSEARSGSLLGPTIYTAGPTIDGIPPLNEMFLTAETPEAARAIVRDQKRAGYDLIRLYGTLRPDGVSGDLAGGRRGGDPGGRGSADARPLPPAAYSQWMSANNRNDRDAEAQQRIETMKGIQEVLYKLVGLIHDRGVRLVAGTDAAAYGFPGLSLHQELRDLVEAGFSPYEALLTATRNPGDFMAERVSLAPRFGTIAVGNVADVVLLSANPLEDIRSAAKIEGVSLRGRWLSAADLRAKETAASARFGDVKRRLKDIDRLLEAGEEPRAEQAAEGVGSDGSFWIAEWVLMTKARKLQASKLPAASEVARLYPQSFSSFYLLADLLFQAGDRAGALAAANRSLALEPHDAAAANLVRKIETVAQPLRFAPAGTY